VHFRGEDITGLAPEAIARRGMVRTFQIVQPFAGQTVRENIAVGAHLHRARAPMRSRARKRSASQVGLGDRLDLDAASLTVAGASGWKWRAPLPPIPKLILFDEVLAGLNPSEIRDVIPVIRAIRDDPASPSS
jgi:branched-chain amino acid transport system ATP-binding protein